jgi:hypothetical protein
MAINQNKIDALKAKCPLDIADWTSKIQDADAQIQILVAKKKDLKEKIDKATAKLSAIAELEAL